jgi:hypothetical protein
MVASRFPSSEIDKSPEKYLHKLNSARTEFAAALCRSRAASRSPAGGHLCAALGCRPAGPCLIGCRTSQLRAPLVVMASETANLPKKVEALVSNSGICRLAALCTPAR